MGRVLLGHAGAEEAENPVSTSWIKLGERHLIPAACAGRDEHVMMCLFIAVGTR